MSDITVFLNAAKIKLSCEQQTIQKYSKMYSPRGSWQQKCSMLFDKFLGFFSFVNSCEKETKRILKSKNIDNVEATCKLLRGGNSDLIKLAATRILFKPDVKTIRLKRGSLIPNSFKTFEYQHSEGKNILPGQIGFLSMPKEHTDIQSAISMTQRLVATKGANPKLVHAIIVLGTDSQDPNTIIIGEASGHTIGLKERKLDLSKLPKGQRLKLAEYTDEMARQKIAEIAKHNVDQCLEQKETLRARIKAQHNKSDLYSRTECLEAVFFEAVAHSKKFGKLALKHLANSVSDNLLGRQFGDRKGCTRRSFMCSSFAATCVQTALFLNMLSTKYTNSLVSYGLSQGRKELVKIIKSIIKNLMAEDPLFKQKIFNMDAAHITPASLAYHFGVV